MEPIDGSETSAYNNQTPWKHPKEYIIDPKHGESLKSRIVYIYIYIYIYIYMHVFFTIWRSWSGERNKKLFRTAVNASCHRFGSAALDDGGLSALHADQFASVKSLVPLQCKHHSHAVKK